MHRDDYAGEFDPSFQWPDLSRSALGRLGREIMLCAMMHDRGLLPQVGRRYGPDAMTDVAVDEWMGSSPIYNQRNRSLLGIEGDDVGSILKGLQLDIGAPHQFLDFQFELVDERRGYFWLPFCGAYSYVKSMSGSSDRPIFQLCHHMEDTTFDATVMAVNPYARCVPEHRPPLDLDHEGPVCRWRVEISEEHGAVLERPLTETMRRSRAARFEHEPIASSPDGLSDYAGDFRPGFVLEDLSQPVLARQCKEFALDLQLLVRAAYTSLSSRYGASAMKEIARVHWAAMAPVYSARIRRALGIEGDGIDAVLKGLQVDPCFAPDYVRIGCDRIDARRGRFWIRECEALLEDEPRAFLGLLEGEEGDALEAVACAVNPRARVTPISPGSCPGEDVRLAFEIEICASAPEREREPLSDLVRSNILDFGFRSGGDARSA
ncbi:MAG: hypothetical protein VX574_12480 [Myxococcota bacterium]|nr:hypothetical protein [Myxococcota bacterium]